MPYVWRNGSDSNKSCVLDVQWLAALVPLVDMAMTDLIALWSLIFMLGSGCHPLRDKGYKFDN